MPEPVSGLAAADAVFGASLFEAGAAGGLFGGFAGDAFLADAVFGTGALEAGLGAFAGETALGATEALGAFADPSWIGDLTPMMPGEFGAENIVGDFGQAVGRRTGSGWLANFADNPVASMSRLAQPWGDAGRQPWGSPGNIASLYSGYRGLQEAKKLEALAKMSGQRMDPWGQSGGRAAAGQQLQGVVSGGSDAYMQTPAYQARMQAVQRAMAPYGRSGNLATAAAAAGGAGYNDYVQQMAGLAGVGNAGGAGEIELRGAGLGADMTSRALASLGYAGQRAQPFPSPGQRSSSWFQ